MNDPRLTPVDEHELRLVAGGGLFSWLGSVVGAIEGVVRSLGRPWT